MFTKRLIKVRSQFEDGYLKSFELISVTPEMDTSKNYDYVSFGDWSTYVDDILWIDVQRQHKHKYEIHRDINKELYERYFKNWNSNADTTVIDVGKNIIGEL